MAQITITIDARNVRQRLRERQDEVEKELDEAKRELKAANARVKEAERLLGRLYEERRGFASLFGRDDRAAEERDRLREGQTESDRELHQARLELRAANAAVKEAERVLGRLNEEQRGFASLFGLDDAVLVAAVKRHGWQVRDEEYERTA